MFINKKSPVPVYYQLKEQILRKIEKGEYRQGEPIPSERNFSQELEISRMTVRQALSQLVSEGVLVREKGKGTFVSRPKIEQKNIMSFSDMARKKDMRPSTEILNFSGGYIDSSINSLLDLENSSRLNNCRRLRKADDIPVGIEEVFIPEEYCPGIEDYDLTGSLYKLLREKYHYHIKYVDNSIEARCPDDYQCRLLKIHRAVPVLIITALYFTDNDKKLFYERSVYRSDEYKYNVRINQ